jgi:hypothetical protein
VTSLSHAKRGGAVVLSLGLFALGLAALPGAAHAAADPCATPTKSVTYSGATASTHGTVKGDTTVGSVTITDETDGSQTAEWPAVDTSYYYCTATGHSFLKSTGAQSGPTWTVTNDGSQFAQFYFSDTGEYLNDITVTYAVGTPPKAPSQSLPAYRSGQRFVIRSGIDPSGQAVGGVNFGAASDLGLFGDWNGDGNQSPGVYRPSTRTFYFASDADGTTVTGKFLLGAAGDKPIVGDFDGDGTETIGVYRPSNATFYLTNNNQTVVSTLHYGTGGDKPVVGDWNGDGTATVGVFRPSNATFYRPGLPAIRFGTTGDVPVIGDWDGDKTSNLGIVRGTTWHVARADNRTSYPSFAFGPKGAGWLALTISTF